ncbi:MAG: hemerythrin family protein [Euryarchaeota archaeon]|nr:hemerythrin family protein [Euryarchaeota archaeon]
MLKWSERLATGVEEIDSQHRELFRRINSLLEACSQRRGEEKIAEVMDFLEEYIVVHFGTEERYMRRYNYPGYSSHRAQHAKFISEFSELRRRLRSGRVSTVVIPTNRLLVDWWINHIGGSDRELGEFLKGRI